MSLHSLSRQQFIPAPLERVWSYFSCPENLDELTPPDMHFEILTPNLERMYAGQLIEYRVMFAPGLYSRWLTEIAHVRAGEYFVDEQRLGPYRFWYHAHHFRPTSGGVEMSDRVAYVIPGGPLGDLLDTLWIRQRLEAIFDYRARKIIELFGAE
jgi:ligand-binding SRPBCC domain-containing protein